MYRVQVLGLTGDAVQGLVRVKLQFVSEVQHNVALACYRDNLQRTEETLDSWKMKQYNARLSAERSQHIYGVK